MAHCETLLNSKKRQLEKMIDAISYESTMIEGSEDLLKITCDSPIFARDTVGQSKGKQTNKGLLLSTLIANPNPCPLGSKFTFEFYRDFYSVKRGSKFSIILDEYPKIHDTTVLYHTDIARGQIIDIIQLAFTNQGSGGICFTVFIENIKPENLMPALIPNTVKK